MDAVSTLSGLLSDEKDRIARLWAKRLLSELQEADLSDRTLRAPLAELVHELARLLKDRGEDAVRLWPEAVRAHGAGRFEQRFDADDVVREFKVLHQVILGVAERRLGHVDAALAQLVSELTGEATAAVIGSYSRALRTEEVRFREAGLMESVLHHVEVGILLVERDGAVSFATPPIARLFGVPFRAFTGTAAGDSLKAILSRVKARHLNGDRFRLADMPFVKALELRKPVRNVFMTVERATDGKEISIEMGATPIWDEVPGGELFGVLQTLTDRTETAQKTRELSHAYEELQKLQGRLLQRTRMQALGQLASGAAHALNNFLNVLRLRITLLRREFKPEHLDALDRTVRSIGDLVSRLQEFSVHRSEEDLTDADFGQIVREALEMVTPELGSQEKPISVDAQLSVQAKTRVDATLLRELVVNLALLAKDRMPDGGKLTIQTSQENGWVSLCLQDTGAAYSPEEFAQLFDPLKGKGRAPQLSLLLAVGRNQVQRWGGELWCENTSGEHGGALFSLRLPIAELQPALERKAPERVVAPRRSPDRRRVLIVDDDPENARMMSEVLAEEGYDTTTAPNGGVALQLWEQRAFDAALLDVLMPDMSGWELARELRKRTPQALLAVVTGADVRGQNRSNLALVDAVFRKPIDVAALDDFLSQGQPGAAEMPILH